MQTKESLCFAELPELRYSRRLGILNWLRILGVITVASLCALPSILRCIVTLQPQSVLWRVTMAAFMRRLLKWTSLWEIHAMTLTPLSRVLEGFTLRKERRGLINYNTQVSDDLTADKLGGGIRMRWLHESPGRERTDPIVFYLHGGGYTMKTHPMQIQWLLQLLRSLRLPKLSIAALDYCTLPHFKPPCQLDEAIIGYRELSRLSSNIVLIGDSAGGHLALALCIEINKLHMQQPGGLLAISPWVQPVGRPITDSEVQMANIDWLHPSFINQLEAEFPASDAFNPQVNLLLNSAETWATVLPKNSALVYGKNEVMRDMIRKLAKVIRFSDFLEEKDAIHDCMCFGTDNDGFQFCRSVLAKWLA